ncbi:hypothetical protein BCR44DRAFT_1435518 [Catenaria anguillulae PL171]|uniref:Uncharacterized protein n=1 Tax=Catenaria anguillulae PL171 TaxID=765915 RepID=A0A1Y2HK84_9FUNG|nr:hypothetical protein BCR44DRAFT_1435518 [Catenaria anguillulae PL171]
MSKLADDIILDANATANPDGSVTNGGTVSSPSPNVLYSSAIVTNSQASKIATPRGSIASMRRSSQSVLAAAQLVSQMAAVTSQVAATSEQVLNGRRSGQSSANMLKDSDGSVGLAAQVVGNPAARSKEQAGGLPTSQSSGPVLERDSAVSGRIHHSTLGGTASPPNAGSPDPASITTTIISAVTSPLPTITPPNASPRKDSSENGAVHPDFITSTRQSTNSLNPRPPPRLEPVRAVPQLPALGGDGHLPGMALESNKLPGTASPPAPVFQVVVAGDGEDGGQGPKKQPDFEFIPVAPKLDLPTDIFRKARTKSMDEGQAGGAAALAAAKSVAAAKIQPTPDTPTSPLSPSAPITATAAKRWKSNAKRKGAKSSERQRRLEEGRRRGITEIPDTIRLDMIREALPVVSKMVSEYKSQLGDRDEITQIAVAHFAKLQSMLSRSHAYADDGVSVMDDDGVVTAGLGGGKLGTGGRAGMSKSGMVPSVSGLMGGGGKAVAMGGIMGPSAGGVGGGGAGGMIGGMPHLGGGLKVKKTAVMSTTAVKKEKKLDDIMSDDQGKGGGFVSLLLPGQK